MKAATTASGGGAVSTSQTVPRNFVALEGVSGVAAVEFPRPREKVVGMGMGVVVQGEREAGQSQRTAVGFVSNGSACTKQWPTTRPRYLQLFLALIHRKSEFPAFFRRLGVQLEASIHMGGELVKPQYWLL